MEIFQKEKRKLGIVKKGSVLSVMSFGNNVKKKMQQSKIFDSIDKLKEK